MTQISKKVGAIVAASAFVFSVAPSIFAADVMVTVEDNGSKSNQHVTITDETKTINSQSNNMNVVTVQNGNANTGNVNLKNNTGEGGSSVVTGTASVSNTSKVMGGSNTIITPDCGCDTDSTTVDVSGNGYKSHTKVKVTKKVTNKNTQNGDLTAYTEQTGKSKTGKITVKGNTGDGEQTVETGDGSVTNKSTVKSQGNFIGPDVL